jgi:hypothetical protein
MSLLITAYNLNDFHTKSAPTLIHMGEWFRVNVSSLCIDKTWYYTSDQIIFKIAKL